MPNIALIGQVLVKESQRGVGGLLVVAIAGKSGRLGSTVSDVAGRFVLDVALPPGAEDTELTLTVMPPDGATPSTPLLHTAPRVVTGGHEEFVLWVSDAALAAAAVERPAPTLAATPDPAVTGRRVAADIGRRKQLAGELAASYAPAIADRREAARASYRAVEGLLQAELGMNRKGRPRVVAPGANVAEVVATSARDAIANVAANGSSFLRLTIEPAQFESLRVPNSPLLDRTRVEEIAFASGARARTRVDAVPRWCALLTRPLPMVALAAPPPSPRPPAETSADLEAALARIVDEIAHRTAPVITPRADDASVRGRLRALDLAAGPADRVAFFDYGTLVGTIDGVWQELLDRDLVANAADLFEALTDAGGGAPGPDPLLRFLESEASAVHHASTDGPRLMTRELPSPAAMIRGGWQRFMSVFRHQQQPAREQVVDHRDGQPSSSNDPPPQLPTRPPEEPATPEYAALLAELKARMDEPYAFQVFAADGDQRAIDFGLFVAYRQTWTPQGNQAGALVKTTTLAPREERSFTTRTTYRRSTTAVRATNFENQRRSESQETTRAASDIVNAAKVSLGFEATTSGTVEVGQLISADSSATTTRNSEHSSQETRQSMREAVRRAAHEAKESIRTEVTTTESTETAHEESGKISNPNDEIPVTYLFYELQRRFRVSERVHQVVPVVMVARPVPSPEQITRGWLFTNGWILQRALLDEQFARPLRYLMDGAAGLEAKVSELQAQRDEHRALATKLEGQVLTLSQEVERRYQQVQNAAQGLLAALTGNDEETAKKAYDLAVQRDQIMRERLAEAVAARDAATQAYTEALAELRDSELAVGRLRIHVKQNILHYMRAIWNMEDRDQRYFELHSVRVPRLAGHLDYRLVEDRGAPPVPPLWMAPYKIEATLVPENVDPMSDTVQLGHVADLEHPLGYKGNFMVFPLRQHNVLTKFLALPYLDNRMGACDPELLANFTLSELDEYVACAREALPAEQLADLIPRVQVLYKALLERPFPDEEEIVVPTDSTFIEALPGTRPVLEDYKLLHRVIDVAKAAAEARARELENLRLVARIRAGQLSDPDIQTMVVAPEDAGVTVNGGG